MRLLSTLSLTILFVATSSPGVAMMPRPHRGPTSQKLFGKRSATVPRPATHSTSQRLIESGRASQIQSALIKHGYLIGSPTGVWDAQTEAAMQRVQAENGWQTKVVPDARAIIKLGLGPNATSTETEPTVTSIMESGPANN